MCYEFICPFSFVLLFIFLFAGWLQEVVAVAGLTLADRPQVQGKSGFDKTKFSQTVSWSLNLIELSTLLSLSALSPTVVAWHSTMTLATERNPLFSECRVERERHPKLNWFTRHFLTFTAFLTFILSGVELLLSLFFFFFYCYCHTFVYYHFHFCWLHFLPEGKPRHPALDACRKRQRKEIIIKCRLRVMHGGSHVSTGNICTSPSPPPQ